MNIVEDYPIAGGKSSASKAKKQVFRCETVVCEKEAFDTYYSDINHNRVNTFSLTDNSANLHLDYVDYSLDETEMTMIYNNVKTINGNFTSGNISLKTFAPGRHHASNVLGVVLTAICLEIPNDKIIEGIKNYRD